MGKKMNTEINIDFDYVRKYMDLYNEDKNNNYSRLRNWAKKHRVAEGIYMFAENDTVIYVGAAYDQEIVKRITQHFVDSDTGGLRHKIDQLSNKEKKKKMLKTLGKCDIYIHDMTGENYHEILLRESLLIGVLEPELNFMDK